MHVIIDGKTFEPYEGRILNIDSKVYIEERAQVREVPPGTTEHSNLIENSGNVPLSWWSGRMTDCAWPIRIGDSLIDAEEAAELGALLIKMANDWVEQGRNQW